MIKHNPDGYFETGNLYKPSSDVNAVNNNSSAAPTSPFQMKQVLVSLFHFPAFETDLYNPVFTVFYPEQRVCFLSAN
jgi:hypothetical protein